MKTLCQSLRASCSLRVAISSNAIAFSSPIAIWAATWLTRSNSSVVNGSDVKRQTRYILENYARTFKAAGTSLANVVKAQVFMMNLDDFQAFDEVWKEFFPTPPPRTTVGTTGLLVPGALLEVDLIAAMP